jgi:hypothetical protein
VTSAVAAEITVTVTLDHIERGTEGSETNCPWAYAFADAGYTQPFVCATGEVETAQGDFAPVDLDAFCEWLSRFDLNRPVTPERFRFRQIAKSAR